MPKPSLDQKLSENSQSWDSRVPVHLNSDFYDLNGFRAGECSLNSIELEALGSVEGKSLLHLQCHFGQDTLSFARRGAQVTGVDFSAVAIAEARNLAEELGIEARFLESDVLKLRQELSEQFDLVFTSYGVLGWLPDLHSWAKVVSQSLKPGALFYMVEFHPTLMMLDFERGSFAYPYFHEAYSETFSGTYADRSDQQCRIEHSWSHSLSDILEPLLKQGLSLLEFKEFDYSPYGCFSGMTETEPGKWRHPVASSFPHLFSVKMKKN